MSGASDQLPPMIRDMLRRDFYPHATADEIRLVQTHISYVLLTGLYAYKIKKPVNLGFLDFSTLDRRRQFCHEEMRLNRRGADDIYLQVVGIGPADGHFVFCPISDATEYAVKMRQFADDALASHLLSDGRLGEVEVRQVAARLAVYHAGAITNPKIADFGQPERVAEAINDNYHHTSRFIGSLQSPEQNAAIRAFTDSFIREHGDRLRQRAAERKVRECHGDLHLANICFIDGKPQFFDCIEFNEAFRYVDVMYDLAFAAMDLRAAGRGDLSTLLVNEYVERTGDYDGLEVLPLYLCRQAYVRAKIQSLTSIDEHVAPAEAEAAKARAKSYYELAAYYASIRPSRLIVVCGQIGAGKSTVARALASAIDAVHIRSDAVRKHLAGIDVSERGDANLYSQDMSRKTYSRMVELGARLVRQNYSVILDAKFDRQADRELLQQEAETSRQRLVYVHCTARPDIRRSRISNRRGDASDATADMISELERPFEPFGPGESVITIDTERSLDIAALSDFVRNR